MQSNSSKLKNILDSGLDYLREQTWFQELKTKWDELDQKSKTYVEFAAAGGIVLILIGMTLSGLWSVHRASQILSEKTDLLKVIQSANDEVRLLRDTIPTAEPHEMDSAWNSYLETTALNLGISPSNLHIEGEKTESLGEHSRETLLDLHLKHINIKQLIRYTHSIETGSRPMKIRNLKVETKGDRDGYLEATIALSGFSRIAPK